MADWNLPTTSSTYANFLTEFNNKLLSVAKLNLSADTNLVDGMIYYDQAGKRFKLRSSGAWADLNVHDVIADKAGSATISGIWQHNAVLRMNAGLELLALSPPSAPASGGVLWMSAAHQVGIKTSDGTTYVLELDWQTWSPTLGQTGGMTLSNVSFPFARYKQDGKLTLFDVNANFDLSGSGQGVTITLPNTLASSTYRTIGFGTLDNTGVEKVAMVSTNTSTSIVVWKDGFANWTTATSNRIRIKGFYENT